MASYIQIKRIEKMKKLLLSIALLGGVVLTSQAQTDKGDVILGGNVSFNTIKTDASGANSSYDLSIVPNVGYFVDDNIAIGTGIGYQTSRLDEASELGKTEAFVIAPFGRSEEHTSELQSRENLVCRLLLEKKKQNKK